MNITLIVTDAGPLITLAVADALDALLLPGIRVVVPDIVYFEVTRQLGKPGAQAVVDWVAAKGARVDIAETEEFAEFRVLLAVDALRHKSSRNRGEPAVEVLVREFDAGAEAAILLFEDSGLKKANFLGRIPDNVLLKSTSSYLYGLERRKLVPDAQQKLERAVAVRGGAIVERRLMTTGADVLIAGDWRG
jgi:hypothetical protein